KFSENSSLTNYWSRYVSFKHSPPIVEQLFDLRTKILSEVKALLTRKTEKPLDQIEISSVFSQLVRDYEDLCAEFSSYNEQLSNATQLIENKKNETKKA